MKRSTRADKAQETLKIIEQGSYNRDNKNVDIKDEIAQSVRNAILYRSDEFETVMNDAGIKLENTTVLQAASSLAVQNRKVGCLNFASAKNPVGGFLGGAIAMDITTKEVFQSDIVRDLYPGEKGRNK